MEIEKKYSDERRTHTIDDIREDNAKCDWLIKQEISYMIARLTHPGTILYPDNEVSVYRHIEDALAISFQSYLMAETYLDCVRNKAWRFNIYRGVNSEGEPPVEKWNTVFSPSLVVIVMWQVADSRKKYNNFRLNLLAEEERLLPMPIRKERSQGIVWRNK